MGLQMLREAYERSKDFFGPRQTKRELTRCELRVPMRLGDPVRLCGLDGVYDGDGMMLVRCSPAEAAVLRSDGAAAPADAGA